MLGIEETTHLSSSARRLLAYVEQHPNAVLVSSALDLANRIDSSDATVIRAIQSLGFEGLPHLKSVIAEKLDKGERTPAEKVDVTLNQLKRQSDRSPFEFVTQAYGDMLSSLTHSSLSEQLDAAVKLLDSAERIGLYGGGPPVRLAQQTATHLGRIGRKSFVLEASGHAFADALLDLRSGDAVILIAYGTILKESLLLASEVRNIGGQLIVLTDNPNGRLAQGAHAVIEVPRAEVGNMMLYGTILLTLETIVLSLMRLQPDSSLDTARRLQQFRAKL